MILGIKCEYNNDISSINTNQGFSYPDRQILHSLQKIRFSFDFNLSISRDTIYCTSLIF
jgi:hypothetical protein